MYPRSRGRGGPQGAGYGDADASSFTDSSPPTFSGGSNSNEQSYNAIPSAPPQQQQQPPQQPPQTSPLHQARRSPGPPYSPAGYAGGGGYPGGKRGDPGYYPPPQQMPPPPPPPPPMQGSVGYYDETNAPNAGQPQYYGGGAPPPGVMRRGPGPSYDMPPPPPPPPPAGGYAGEWAGSTPTSPPSAAGGPNMASNYPTFSQHSRTSSSNAMGVALGGDRGMPGNEYRPPPIYGDVPPPPPGTMSGNASGSASFHRVGPSGSGHNANSGSGTRLPSYPPAGASGGVPSAGNTAPLPPQSQTAGPAMSASSAAPAGSNSASVIKRHYDGSSSSVHAPMNPASGPRQPRGPTGLKITVGGSAAVVPTSAPLSPLLNSPLQSGAGQGGDSANSRAARRPQPEGGKPAPNSSIEGHQNTSSTTGPGDSDGEPPASTSKPTVEQAEARYQYLYEEFRKVSRVRSKLAEDIDRLRREIGTLREELGYYRQKTLTAAEEREAIVHDYNADVHYLLRLVDALASDVVAANTHSHSARYGSNGGDGPRRSGSDSGDRRGSAGGSSQDKTPPPLSSPQQAVDVAAARLTSVQARSPSLSTSVTGAPVSVPPGLAERLGLRHGMWMVAPPALSAEDGPAESSLTPAQQQSLLLRDEMRDVHRSAHAAMSSYMTSLDYGFVPTMSQRGFPPGSSVGNRRQAAELAQQQQQHLQQQFNSEYRGLRLHVEVPRMHAQSVTGGAAAGGAADAPQAGGQTPENHSGNVSVSTPKQQPHAPPRQRVAP